MQSKMGTVVAFTAHSAQGTAFLKTQFWQRLGVKGADDERIEYATKQRSFSYSRPNDSEQYNFSVRFPESLSGEETAPLQEGINLRLEDIWRKNHTLLWSSLPSCC